MQHLIVLDTNIIRSDFLFKSNPSRILLEFIEKTSSSLAIPSIVFQELISLYEKELNERLSNLNKSKNHLNGILLANELISINDTIDIEDSVRKYEQYLKSKLEPSLIELDYKNSFLPEIVRRSIKRVKPISQKGEEFRDALLWLTVLNFLKTSISDYKVSFITSNARDFANENKDDLHPDLMNEIRETRSTFYFYPNLGEFNKLIAINVNSIDKKWIIENLDWEQIQKNAETAIDVIDPHFFYEYYHANELSEDELHVWGPIYARFYNEISNFYIYESLEPNKYKIHVLLNGTTEIEFVTIKEKFIQREIEFGSTLYLTIENMKIVNCEGYFPEETALWIDTP